MTETTKIKEVTAALDEKKHIYLDEACYPQVRLYRDSTCALIGVRQVSWEQDTAGYQLAFDHEGELYMATIKLGKHPDIRPTDGEKEIKEILKQGYAEGRMWDRLRDERPSVAKFKPYEGYSTLREDVLETKGYDKIFRLMDSRTEATGRALFRPTWRTKFEGIDSLAALEQLKMGPEERFAGLEQYLGVKLF